MGRIVRGHEVEPGVCHQKASSLGDIVAWTSRAPYKTDAPNEDNFAIIEVDDENLVLVVADGVGGSPAGQDASRIVVDRLADNLSGDVPPGTITATIFSALEEAHQQIRASGSGAASTVAVAHIEPGAFRSAHAGDSIVLQCGGLGKTKFMTIAHSPVGYALEAGVLSEDEAFMHEDRHVVSNIIGGEDLSIALGATLPIARRDTLVLATDGLTDNLRQAEIIELARKGPLVKCAEQLATLGLERMSALDAAGKPDDMTFVLFRRTARK